MPGHGNARSEGAQPAESTAVMEALAAMGDRLNQSLDAFNKHLTSMDSSIQHSEAEMGERLSAMARRIEELEVKNATSGPTISQVNEPQSTPLAKPSEHAMKSFLALSTKSLSQQLKGSNTFASWQFALQVTLSIVFEGC